MSDNIAIIVTCEHATPGVPREYAPLFAGAKKLLESHRGWDIGAVEIALGIARALQASVHLAPASRLLVDLNRSLHHQSLFSEVTSSLTADDKDVILERYWIPYRTTVERDIEKALRKRGRVLHLSVHSFTPELDGKVRNADIALLYDPSKRAEKELCERWLAEIHRKEPSLRLRRNYPYRGAADGLTTHLRRTFGTGYLGIEVESNQALTSSMQDRERIVRILLDSLRTVVR